MPKDHMLKHARRWPKFTTHRLCIIKGAKLVGALAPTDFVVSKSQTYYKFLCSGIEVSESLILHPHFLGQIGAIVYNTASLHYFTYYYTMYVPNLSSIGESLMAGIAKGKWLFYGA